MILGSQVEWALHCMTALGSLPPGSSATAKRLAEFHGVPKEYLAKALQALAAAGLVESSTGPKGGYSLARAPGDISLLDVIEAVEGRQRTFNCAEIRRNNPCWPGARRLKLPPCQIAAVMYEADDAWREVLRKKRLTQILESVRTVAPPALMDASRDWLLGG